MTLQGRWLLLIVLGSGPSCTTYSDHAEKFRAAYAVGAWTEAEEVVDGWIAGLSGVDEEAVKPGAYRNPAIKVEEGDTPLLSLEKGMLRLAQGDAADAIGWWRRARDEFDRRLDHDSGAALQKMSVAIRDDTVRPYVCFDYEHILVRVMLSLADLISGEGDAYAYAAQVGKKQEEILGSPFGSIDGVEDYRPRQEYRRVAIGAYLQGLLQEANLAPDEAAKAYARAAEYSGGKKVYEQAQQRASSGHYSAEGRGVVHVFFLNGRGPDLVETVSAPTELSLRLAGAMMLFLRRDPSLLFQSRVPVPGLRQHLSQAPRLDVSSAMGTQPAKILLNVNQVAEEQLRANSPWTIARAIVRRTLKQVASSATRYGVGRATGSQGLGDLAGVLISIGSTAAENADTRSWSTLPAFIQGVRMELPEGAQTLRWGTSRVDVRVTAGRDTYVLVLQPGGTDSAAILVDRYSRPLSPAP